MRRSKLTTSLYLLLVFLSGSVVGIFGYRLYTMNSVSASTSPRTPEQYKRKYLEEMRTRLKLDTGQVNQLSSIMDETRRRFREQHDRSRPELDQIQKEQHAKVNALLNDGQRAEYKKMVAERDKRRAFEHKRE
ncbi:MAG: hypothetical protein M3Z85_00340 [Acidobacteriota bacterium]|nr:hypothetical protein [Acidobacteriota bacterium]